MATYDARSQMPSTGPIVSPLSRQMSPQYSRSRQSEVCRVERIEVVNTGQRLVADTKIRNRIPRSFIYSSHSNYTTMFVHRNDQQYNSILY